MLVNSLSKHTDSREVGSQDAETSLSMTSKAPVMELNVTECEDSEPRKEDLQRITELMDGFKASKVTRDEGKTRFLHPVIPAGQCYCVMGEQ